MFHLCVKYSNNIKLQNMKNQIKITAIIFLTLFTSIGCYKESMQTSTSAKKQSALTDLFKNIAPPMQNFTVTAGLQQLVTGEKGTKITFYSNSFKKKDGTILTSGNVKIVLQEMLTGPEMILARKTTTSNGRLLVSGGQIFIKAYLGNEELLINKSARPIVEIPTNSNDNMNLFIGNIKANDSIIGDSTNDWTLVDTIEVVRRQDTFGKSVFIFPLDSLTFINCDYFYNDPNPKTDVKYTLPNSFVDSNTQIMIYFPSINSVARAYKFVYSGNYFILDGGYQVPVGLQAKVIAIAKKGNEFYFEVKSITVAANLNVNMNPTVSSEAAIKLAIKGL